MASNTPPDHLKEDNEYFGSKEDHAEDRTIASREKVRCCLNEQIKDFLAQGGAIKEVERNVCMDPPRKPDSKYGCRPI